MKELKNVYFDGINYYKLSIADDGHTVKTEILDTHTMRVPTGGYELAGILLRKYLMELEEEQKELDGPLVWLSKVRQATVKDLIEELAFLEKCGLQQMEAEEIVGTLGKLVTVDTKDLAYSKS